MAEDIIFLPLPPCSLFLFYLLCCVCAHVCVGGMHVYELICVYGECLCIHSYVCVHMCVAYACIHSYVCAHVCGVCICMDSYVCMCTCVWFMDVNAFICVCAHMFTVYACI